MFQNNKNVFCVDEIKMTDEMNPEVVKEVKKRNSMKSKKDGKEQFKRKNKNVSSTNTDKSIRTAESKMSKAKNEQQKASPPNGCDHINNGTFLQRTFSPAK